MRKNFFLLLFTLAVVSASAQQDTLKYRISLTDKAATAFSLKHSFLKRPSSVVASSTFR